MQEVLPKSGLVFSERSNLTEILCKPKTLPIKSMVIRKMEQLEKEVAAQAKGAGTSGITGRAVTAGGR